MNKIPMTPFAATIHKTGRPEIGYQVPDFGRHGATV
jgi:hypothetical protein